MAPAAARRPLEEMWLEGRKASTVAAYRKDLRDFARFLGAADGAAAIHELLAGGQAVANERVLSYRNAMRDNRLSPATINRRVAALRSLVKLANSLGHVSWTLGVEGVKKEKRRDMRGPEDAELARLFAAAAAGMQAARDVALLRLLHDMALRRAEVAGLELVHIDLARGALSVLGKGRREREWLTAPAPTQRALSFWLAARGDQAGSLFGLTGDGVYAAVRSIAKRAGLQARPHGLRHSGITHALDRVKDVRAVQKFSRHASLDTLLLYDDSRRDHYGDVAAVVAAGVSDETMDNE